METQQGRSNVGAASTQYLTGMDRPVRRFGDGGQVTPDGRQKPLDLKAAKRSDRLANALGWFSIGLGVAQITAPRRMNRLIGVNDSDRNKAVMRAVGVREIAAGIGLLADPKPTGFAMARVAGDVMDLALLTNAMQSNRNDRGRTAIATAAVLGIGALDVFASEQLATTVPRVAHPTRSSRGLELRKSVTVSRPIEEVYAFWRNFENLPRFMRHLRSVQTTGEGRSRWTANSPSGAVVEFDVEIIEDRQNELIAWRTIGVSEVTSRGQVSFRSAPGGRGTEVHMELDYRPPGGQVAARIAKFFRDVPGIQIENELYMLKQILETGEVVVSDASLFKGPHPAQPPDDRSLQKLQQSQQSGIPANA